VPTVTPPVVTPAPTAVTPPPATATPAETVDDPKVEYQKLLNATEGDRQKILKDEKRLPDYINDEDNDYKKADHWQYESEDGITMQEKGKQSTLSLNKFKLKARYGQGDLSNN
jgi:hypothetical protein